MSTKETTKEEQPVSQTESGNHSDISIKDLATIRSIIDVASQRGAFKAGELESVGQVYNKIDAIINAQTAQQNGGAAQ